MRFQFIIALVIAEHILHSTVYLSTFLQDTDYDILEAIKESKTVIEMLRAERQDESVYDELYQSTLSLAKSFDISDSIPRRGGRRTTRANPPRKRQYSIFVLSIFGQFDYKLETRLLKLENRFHAQHLLPRAVDKLTNDIVATIYDAYQADIFLSLEDFRREVA
jgi:hypothetical protein